MRLLPLAAALALAGCPGTPRLPDAAPRPAGAAPGLTTCGGLDASACGRARGLLAAATSLSNVQHEYLLDTTSSFATGRGLQRTEDGLWRPIPTACARPTTPSAPRSVDAATIDVGFIGVAIDTTLVGADADLTPYFSAGGSGGVHKLRLLAVAFVRDLDPQFFEATDDLAYESKACACGRATHFVGAVKMGGLLAYEIDVREAEVHGRALEFVKAKLESRGGVVTESRVGGLEIDGLDAMLTQGARGAARPVAFRVKNPVPIAYDVYPLADVCKFALPEPQVSPTPVDFGDVPYGQEATRLLHVVNRAAIDLTASFRGKLFEVPARGSTDLTSKWTPFGEAARCEPQTREEEIVFSPRDASIPVTPRRQTVRVLERVRTGRALASRRERVETGERPDPDYGATARDWTCPPDYEVAACRADHAQCAPGDGDDPEASRRCAGGGYAVTAVPAGNGCHFGCQGRTSLLISNFCRFDAVMECRLRCGDAR